MKLELIKYTPKSPNQNKPLLFLHGMWHGAWCWEPNFLPYFAELGYTSYAMSLSNHANSPKRKIFNLLSINDYVKNLKEVIDSFEETPILVGHSMGGFVIQKYLEKFNVPGAILIAPVAPFGIWSGTMQVIKKFPLTFLKANITLNLKHIINTPKNFRQILCSKNIADEDISKYITKIDSESFKAYIDMLGLNLVNPKKIKTPLIIIGGEKDFAVPEKTLRKTCKVYGVEPIIFEGMGHNIMLEPEYKIVANKIVEWIENL